MTVPRATVVRLALAAALAATPLGAARADADVDVFKPVGTSWEFELRGNPSSGYIWVLDEDSSTGLETLDIESLGYRKAPEQGTKLIVGQPAQYVFRLTCVAAGPAHLYFDFLAPDRKTVGKTQELRTRCE